MANTKTPVSNPTQMRLIEALLIWEGAVSNKRLRELLGCTSVHASRLLSAYKKAYPRQIKRSDAADPGVYIPGSRIKPILTHGQSDEYLDLVRHTPAPRVSQVRTDYSSFAPALFGQLHRAAATGTGLAIRYENDGDEIPVFPHQLIEIGHRWHVRAWDEASSRFRDFHIGLISDSRTVDLPAPVTPEDDSAWMTEIDIGISCHAALGQEQARLVEREFFKGTAGRRIHTRGCLVRHIVAAMKIAVAPDLETPPEYVLQARDPAVLRPWLGDPMLP